MHGYSASRERWFIPHPRIGDGVVAVVKTISNDAFYFCGHVAQSTSDELTVGLEDLCPNRWKMHEVGFVGPKVGIVAFPLSI